MILHRQCTSLWIAIFLSLGWSTPLLAEKQPIRVSYYLKVNIDPAQGNIAVRGRIEVQVRNPRPREIQFALHETFVVRELLVNGHGTSFSFRPAEYTPINPATRNVVVSLPPDISEDRIRLDIEYGGRLKDIPEWGMFPDQEQALDDQINSRLVQLANYSSWYPQFLVFGQPFQFELEVSLPQGWTAVCSGKMIDSRTKDGRAITQWSSPRDIDILIAASPNYKEKLFRLPDAQIEIYYTQMPAEFIESEGRQIADVTKLFTGLLGETTIPAGTIKQVYSPLRKGQGRAGIARPGMIVTSEGRTLEGLATDPNFSLFQDIAHEIAHFWWNFGAGQGDWINEAFAEYFSAVAVQKVSSEPKFENVLAFYRKQVRELPANAPPISKVPFDGSGFVIRYYKGSLMLDQFRHALGDDRFFQACREFFQRYKGKSIGTAAFRDFWKEKLGNENDSLDRWLDSTGGLPDFPHLLGKDRSSESGGVRAVLYGQSA